MVLGARRPARRALPLGGLALLTACDPAYRVGARQAVTPPRGPAPAAAPVGVGTPAPDVPRLADCLEATLRAGPAWGEVRRDKVGKRVRNQYAALHFAVADSLARGGRRYANLHLGAWRGEPAALEVTFLWIGTARTYPAADQRRMAALARSAVVALRAACLPAVPAAVECVDEGIGSRGACAAGAPGTSRATHDRRTRRWSRPAAGSVRVDRPSAVWHNRVALTRRWMAGG